MRAKEVNQMLQVANGLGQQSNVDVNVNMDTEAMGAKIANAVLEALANSLNIDITTNIDGRVVAKSTARYMESEINSINRRKTRLGGAF